MKFAAALPALAFVLAVTAPLAVQGACTTANQNLVDNLAVTTRFKSTTVTGGSKVTQTITVTNNNPTDVSGLVIRTTSTSDLPWWLSPPYKRHKSTMAKGTKPVLNENGATNGAISTPFTLAAGRSFRAKVVYKANTCPQASPVAVKTDLFISTDPNGLTACGIPQQSQLVRPHRIQRLQVKLAYTRVDGCLDESIHALHLLSYYGSAPLTLPPNSHITGDHQQEQEVPLSVFSHVGVRDRSVHHWIGRSANRGRTVVDILKGVVFAHFCARS